ncbi:FAD-linked oxidoreductase family [Labilithrix luteola]|uniref:FAD-linked oxidoreductase family n=1 Tax=Labilithrix luteola TaxID=1391654 RepID=A0A0K1PXD0_9BACT|nr:BBE domain-containing protein [Labilithrix luteola]AKU98178.1 FAD-linked oxidoreductase family [Labilithrix luteola]
MSAANDPDLFWALRGGGGGNFGIVTSFRFAAPKAPSSVVVFSLQFPAGSATNVLGAWQSWLATLPNEAWSNCVVSAGSTPSIRVGGSFVGSKATIDSLLDDFVAKTHAQPTKRSVVEKSYIDAMRYFGGCSTKTLAQCHLASESAGGVLERQAFVASSRMLESPMSAPDQLTALLAKYSGMDVLFDSLGGKVAETPPDATAFPHRTALASVQVYKGTTAANRANATRQVGEVQTALASIVGGGAYINYIDPNQRDWGRASYKGNLEKLASVSRAYDPDGFFAFAQSVTAA